MLNAIIRHLNASKDLKFISTNIVSEQKENRN
jgi:hypothetical protein